VFENYADCSWQADREGLHGTERRHDVFLCGMMDEWSEHAICIPLATGAGCTFMLRSTVKNFGLELDGQIERGPIVLSIDSSRSVLPNVTILTQQVIARIQICTLPSCQKPHSPPCRPQAGAIIRLVVSWSLTRAPTPSITIMSLPQGSKSLLLGMRVDICSDDESNDVEEWYPGLFWEELLRKGECNWGGDPANSHHGPEASADGGAYLMHGARTRDEGHAGKVDGVLDWCDLGTQGVSLI